MTTDAFLQNGSELHQMLIALVTDMLVDKPRDVLNYMTVWAEKREKEPPKPRRKEQPKAAASVTATQKETLPAEKDNDSEAAAAEPTKSAEEMAHELEQAAQKQLRSVKDISDSYKYRYMMALEDSDYDIFQLRKLEASTKQARAETEKALQTVRALTSELNEVKQSDLPEEEKAERVRMIYNAQKQQWETAAA